MSTTLDPRSDPAYRPGPDHDTAVRLAATEYDRVLAVLERLTPGQWAAPTECPGWDVRAMAGHLLGMMQMVTSVEETARQQLAARQRAQRDGGLRIDALTAVQVEENAGLSTSDLVQAVRLTAPRAAAARAHTPAPVRDRTLPDPQDVGGATELWTVGYLLDVILTRDPFMHRLDIARATGVAVPATAEHEGVIVDDVVRDWARRHGAPYRLELTGPAGGTWSHGDGEHLTMDAFEFCRALSGRAPAKRLAGTPVPF